MKKLNVRLWIGGLFCCAALRAADSVPTPVLYERLGGMPAIRAVVDDLWGRIVADARINKWFAAAAADPERTAAYRNHLADLVCEATGGPCHYGGDMAAAHSGRGITAEAFAAMVEDIEASLNHFRVPENEKKELLKLLASLKPAVVQHSESAQRTGVAK